jgi:AcrR family transcriptional regulator
MVRVRTNADVWEQKRILTSLEIERAGLALIVERGLENVTVEQIADAAGISKRTYFRYFRNVQSLLTAVPERESKRICEVVMARPPSEGLLEAFQAIFKAGEDVADVADVRGEYWELELEATALWGQVVRDSPEAARLGSQATSLLAASLEAVVRARGDFGPDDDDAVGAVAAAVAAVVWFAYVRWIERGGVDSLAVRLDAAFDALSTLHAGRDPRAVASTRGR